MAPNDDNAIAGVGPNDPHHQRAEFLRRVRRDAVTQGLTAEPVTVATIGPGPRGPFSSHVAVVSVGNPREAHGPSLAPDIDDRMAQAIATRTCDQTGARYLGHAPGCTDGVGPLAQRWSPGYQAPEDFFQGLASFVQTLVHAFYRAPPRLVAFISGHGGNGVVRDDLERLASRLGVARCLYLPALRTVDDRGEIHSPQHAGSDEHAAARALGPGCMDLSALDAANAAMAHNSDCYRLLREHPAFAGMAGFYCFGDAAFDSLRARYKGVKSAVAQVLEQRRVDADLARGQTVLHQSVQLAARDIEHAAATLGISPT